MKALFTVATGLLLLASASAHAEVYRHVDAQGNVTFSDEPMQGSETIRVKPVTTITLPKPEAVMETDRLLQEVEREGAAYESVSLAHPENDQAFYSGNGTVTFEVRSTPALRQGHRYEVTLDGQPVGQSSSGAITVNNIDRGSHNAGVHIVDQDGIQVKSGQPVSFTLHRPSRLN